MVREAPPHRTGLDRDDSGQQDGELSGRYFLRHHHHRLGTGRRSSASRPPSSSASIWGICLNWGCIPTKALLCSAEIFHYMQHAKDYGLSAEKISYDPKAVVQRSRGVSKRLSDGVAFLMKKNKITVIWGDATLDAPGKLTVKKSAVEGPKGAAGEGSYQ